MDVPCLFDGGGILPVNIIEDMSTLRLMAVGDEFHEPPSVHLSGFAPAQGVNWVINDFEWGDDVKYIRDPETGIDILTRQDVIVKMLQYVPEDAVKIIPTTGKPGIWITQEGDTLRKIAKESYGDGSMWTIIADANSNVARDPDAPIKPKTHIRVPPRPSGAGVKPPPKSNPPPPPPPDPHG
jgi:nucleoid-associated protein YgaU